MKRVSATSLTGTVRRGIRKGFTLIEMVMVMAIIGVLVGGAIYAMKDVSESTRIQQADGDMNTLRSSLMQYRNLAGRFPTTEQGLEALVTRPTSAPKPRRWTEILSQVPLDPWNNPYVYKYPGTKDSSTFEIISYGKDGKAGGGDDMSSQD